jgi:hypothetical protein
MNPPTSKQQCENKGKAQRLRGGGAGKDCFIGLVGCFLCFGTFVVLFSSHLLGVADKVVFVECCEVRFPFYFTCEIWITDWVRCRAAVTVLEISSVRHPPCAIVHSPVLTNHNRLPMRDVLLMTITHYYYQPREEQSTNIGVVGIFFNN